MIVSQNVMQKQQNLLRDSFSGEHPDGGGDDERDDTRRRRACVMPIWPTRTTCVRVLVLVALIAPRAIIAEATSPLAPALELSSSKWYLGGDHIVGHQLNTQLHHLGPRRTHCQGPKFCSFFCTIIKQLENRSDECSIRHRTQVWVNFCRFHKAHVSAFC